MTFITSELVLEAIRLHPGITTRDLAAMLGTNKNKIAMRCSMLEKYSLVSIGKIPTGRGSEMQNTYEVTQ